MFGFNQSIAQRVQQNSHNAKKEQQMLDGIKEAAAQIQYDPISERAMSTATANMRMAAMSIVLQTALILDEGQDEDDEMLPNELLDNLMLEVFDEDEDDEGSDIDASVKAILSANVADAFSSLGVDDSVIDDLFSTDLDVADTAIESACATVIENLPADGEPLDDFVTAFVFGWDDSDNEDGFDAMSLTKGGIHNRNNRNHSKHEGNTKSDLTHRHSSAQLGKSQIKSINGHYIKFKGVKAVRHGKVIIVNKRISGNVVLTAAQKSALRILHSKAKSASVIRKMAKSLKKGYKNMIYHQNKTGDYTKGHGVDFSTK